MTRRLPRRSFVVSSVSLAAVAVTLTLGVSAAQAAAGGNDWWEFGPSGGPAYAVAIQPDGKIVAAGIGNSPSGGGDFMLARYTASGARDTSFGKNGKVLTDFGATESASAIAIQPDGKLVVAGGRFDLARYTTTGALDTSFGTDGKVETHFGPHRADYAQAVAIQPDGKIVVAGRSGFIGGNSDFALARYTTSGTLDTSFGTNGKVLTDFGSSVDGQADAVAVQPDGKIVVAGSTTGPKMNKFALARYTTNGALDKSFGTGGEVFTGFRSSNHSFGKGVALQEDGKIVVAGSTKHAKRFYFALARYTRRGHLDPRFGTGGRVLTRFGSSRRSQAVAYGVAVQTDGKIVAAGWTTYVSTDIECDGNGSSIALARYTTRGTLDTGFGKRGTVAKQFGDGGSFSECGTEDAAAVAIQPDGNIVTAGDIDEKDFMLARYFGH
jgi:uncharacterized delta-60 repeat protein